MTEKLSEWKKKRFTMPLFGGDGRPRDLEEIPDEQSESEHHREADEGDPRPEFSVRVKGDVVDGATTQPLARSGDDTSTTIRVDTKRGIIERGD